MCLDSCLSVSGTRNEDWPGPRNVEIDQRAGNPTMQKVNLTDKKCATCRWWQGERDIQFWNKKPFKVECDAKGDCMSVKTSKPYSSSCPRWVAWEKLP